MYTDLRRGEYTSVARIPGVNKIQDCNDWATDRTEQKVLFTTNAYNFGLALYQRDRVPVGSKSRTDH